MLPDKKQLRVSVSSVEVRGGSWWRWGLVLVALAEEVRPGVTVFLWQLLWDNNRRPHHSAKRTASTQTVSPSNMSEYNHLLAVLPPANAINSVGFELPFFFNF